MSKLIRQGIESEFSIRNLRSVLHQATTEESKAGVVWYEEASNFAASLGDSRVAAGVIAATSPSLGWERNKAVASMVMRGETTRLQTAANLDKAGLIIRGERPLDVLRGPKTRAFYMNIAYPFSGAAVTIDRHAYGALAGRHLTNHELTSLDLGSYAKAQDAYVQLALEESLLPCQVQAIIWVTWRRLKKEKKDE